MQKKIKEKKDACLKTYLTGVIQCSRLENF